MFIGVPMIPFLLITGLFAIVGAWLAWLLSGYIALALLIFYIPILLWMRSVSKKDDQRLRQILLRWRLRFRHLAVRRAWGAVSYSPIRYKKR